MQPSTSTFTIDIRFEEIMLPPFQEILILGKNSSHGKLGILKSFEMLAPDSFEAFDPLHEIVEAVFINKKILRKISQEVVLKVLRGKVFPYVSEGELLKVDFKISIFHNSIAVEE